VSIAFQPAVSLWAQTWCPWRNPQDRLERKAVNRRRVAHPRAHNRARIDDSHNLYTFEYICPASSCALFRYIWIEKGGKSKTKRVRNCIEIVVTSTVWFNTSLPETSEGDLTCTLQPAAIHIFEVILEIVGNSKAMTLPPSLQLS